MVGFLDLDAVIIGVVTGGGYALLAVSITLMYRSTGFLSFAHAAFAMSDLGTSWTVDLAQHR
ncbi:MAG: hypothetical protein S0880_32865 [Actinomycetota bacterium]|nr:hypothetical protein [Actinomycetota bacterium]